jgi:hypothetical protein
MEVILHSLGMNLLFAQVVWTNMATAAMIPWWVAAVIGSRRFLAPESNTP